MVFSEFMCWRFTIYTSGYLFFFILRMMGNMKIGRRFFAAIKVCYRCNKTWIRLRMGVM